MAQTVISRLIYPFRDFSLHGDGSDLDEEEMHLRRRGYDKDEDSHGQLEGGQKN